MRLADIPVKADKPLVSVARHITRCVSTSVIAKILELLLYLISLSLSDIGVTLSWDVVRWIHLLNVLTVGEEEELILNDRTTEGEAEGILILLVELLAVLNVLTRSRAEEVLIVVIVVDRSVEDVRPRLGDRVHPTTREARLTDVEGCDDDLKSIDGLQRNSILTRGTETEDVVVHSTIDLEAIEAAVGTSEGAITIGLRRELGDIVDATRYGGHTLNATAREARSCTSLLEVEVASLLPCDDDPLELGSTILHLDVEGLCFPEGKVDIAQRDCLKANVGDGERVGATWAHPYDAKVPLGIRDCTIGRPCW